MKRSSRQRKSSATTKFASNHSVCQTIMKREAERLIEERKIPVTTGLPGTYTHDVRVNSARNAVLHLNVDLGEVIVCSGERKS